MKLFNFIKKLTEERPQLLYMDNKKYEMIYPKLPKLDTIPTYDRAEFEEAVKMDGMISIILPKTLTRDEVLSYYNELGGIKRFVVLLHEIEKEEVNK